MEDNDRLWNFVILHIVFQYGFETDYYPPDKNRFLVRLKTHISTEIQKIFYKY